MPNPMIRKALGPLLALRRCARKWRHVSCMKRRARKLSIRYVGGITIGKRVQRWNDTTIIMGQGSRIADDCVLWGGGTIVLGANTSIGEGSWICASPERIGGGVSFGSDVNCAAHLYLIDCDHGFRGEGLICKQPLVAKRIIIGNDVWIAANVTVLKGTVVGNHSVIGACSLCNKDYPSGSVIAGVPAKVIESIVR